LLGPNGCGKSTLIKMLLGELEPDSGVIKTGTKLEVAYFDQARRQLDPAKKVAEYISDGREYISINDKEIHVVSYLANFMFNADQARGPIHRLSGGEQNRLLMARIFSQPANLLILDEPTNDLDVESLELLEEMILEYTGTVLLVSHDRAFMDNVISSLLVFDPAGTGQVTEYVGGYSDWHKENSALSRRASKLKSKLQEETKPVKPDANVSSADTLLIADESLSFEDRKRIKTEKQRDKKELDKLPAKIEKLESTLSECNKYISAADFYQQSQASQSEAFEKVRDLESQIEQLMNRWEQLEALL
jgi:ATP-binding cassette subfamily F protein uup